jgi:hypothetical protein
MVLILKRHKAFKCKKEGGNKGVGGGATMKWVNERLGEEYGKEGRRYSYHWEK